MSLESPKNEPLTVEQKEVALQKQKIFNMREDIQLATMKESGFELTGDNDHDIEKIRGWSDKGFSKDYRTAFDKLISEHPDFLEIYNNDRELAIKLVADELSSLHQHA